MSQSLDRLNRRGLVYSRFLTIGVLQKFKEGLATPHSSGKVLTTTSTPPHPATLAAWKQKARGTANSLQELKERWPPPEIHGGPDPHTAEVGPKTRGPQLPDAAAQRSRQPPAYRPPSTPPLARAITGRKPGSSPWMWTQANWTIVENVRNRTNPR